MSHDNYLKSITGTFYVRMYATKKYNYNVFSYICIISLMFIPVQIEVKT